MIQSMIAILDLGSPENPRIAREIRSLGVYSEIHPHDISPEALKALPGVCGVILSGGENRIVDGKAEALEFSVKNDAPYIGIPLHKLRLKPDILIASIIRARRVIIPSGSDEIQKGDTVIIVTTADHTIAELRDIFIRDEA